MNMLLSDIKKLLDCEVITGQEHLDGVAEVICSADLMSDVLAYSIPEAVLLTGLTSAQSVRTADVVDIKAIVYVRGKYPEPLAVDLASRKGIVLMKTDKLLFEASGILYNAGFKGRK